MFPSERLREAILIYLYILMYDDDVKIFNSLDSISGQSTLQKYIDYFCQWCELSQLVGVKL